MFRDITLGQYYPSDSVIHRMDPRVKLLGVVISIASIFIINNIWGFIFLAIVFAAMIITAGIPFKHIFKGLRMVMFLIILAMFFNLFFTDGTIIWQWWILKLTHEGILNAAFFALRIVFIIIGSSMLTYTTTPTMLTNGLEKVLDPLKVIRFPAHELAMMMSIALRFIPILAEEVDKIIKAQLARGADLETGGIIKKAKGMIPILIPLFISAFRRASDLATAMEARCYQGGEGRTKIFPLRYEKRDKAGYIIILLYTILIIVMRILMDNYLVIGRI